METYIIVGTSPAGSSLADFDLDSFNLKEENEKVDKALEAVGGKMLHGWYTFGRFDFIVVVEVPNTTALRAFVACLKAKTETFRAFSDVDDTSEFIEAAKKVVSVLGK